MLCVLYDVSCFFFLIIRRPTGSNPSCPLFPYTTLFRSPLDTLSNPAARANMVSRRPMDHFARPARFTDHRPRDRDDRSEEHTSELQSLMRISYAVFCLKKKNKNNDNTNTITLTTTYTQIRTQYVEHTWT